MGSLKSILVEIDGKKYLRVLLGNPILGAIHYREFPPGTGHIIIDKRTGTISRHVDQFNPLRNPLKHLIHDVLKKGEIKNGWNKNTI